jgi:hypothetical protein
MNKMIAIAAALGAMVSAPALATNLVTNGDFEQLINGPGKWDATSTHQVVGWHSNGYNFTYAAGGLDDNTYLELYGPKNGVANGLVNSPTGGNMVAADGAYGEGAIYQQITGLTVGQQYAVQFDWAAGQQSGYTGPQTERWLVKLGNSVLTVPSDHVNPTLDSQTQATSVAHNANHGFVPWSHETFTFTATGTSQYLSFLALGTPTGVPPFSILDGVSMAAVPEPASWAMMIAGFGLVGGAIRRRRPMLSSAI